MRRSAAPLEGGPLTPFPTGNPQRAFGEVEFHCARVVGRHGDFCDGSRTDRSDSISGNLETGYPPSPLS